MDKVVLQSAQLLYFAAEDISQLEILIWFQLGLAVANATS